MNYLEKDFNNFIHERVNQIDRTEAPNYSLVLDKIKRQCPGVEDLLFELEAKFSELLAFETKEIYKLAFIDSTSLFLSNKKGCADHDDSSNY